MARRCSRLNSDLVLEFIIKEYPEHNGVTKELHNLKSGDEIIIEEPFGTINYKGAGTFLAGGAGITPFIAIFRQLQEDKNLEGNKLIFSNKTAKDVILEKEFKEMFSNDLILTLTEENKKGYESRMIDKNFLKKEIDNFEQNFYVCGPPGFVEDISSALKQLGTKPDAITLEE